MSKQDRKSAAAPSPEPTLAVDPADEAAAREALKAEIRAEVEVEWRASFDKAVQEKVAVMVKEIMAQAKTAPAPAPTTKGGAIPVRYIGKRPVYKEGAYGTGIMFTQGKSEFVPADKAALLLTHKDVYEPGDASECGEVVIDKPATDDSDDPVQIARDSIAVSGKEALEAYARVHFGVELDRRHTLEALRVQVTGLLDQYGLGD